jgi:glycosyl transferase family 9 (putative heptosyltransferase)
MIMFGLHGGIGNSLFCLPAIKALARTDKVSLCVEGDYDMTELWRRCTYAHKVYGKGNVIPNADRYITGQYVPSQFRGRHVEFCGFPRGTSVYAKSEWAQIKGKACGDERKENVSDWICPQLGIPKDIDFALIPCGKPDEEWSRKKWGGFHQLALKLESLGNAVRAFGQADEIREASLQGWWEGPRKLQALPEALLRCRVAICNDSGIGHLACSLGLPSVFIFTATCTKKGEPVGPHHILSKRLPCAPCQSSPRWGACLDWRCRTIAVDDVAEIAIKMLEQEKRK